MKKTIFLRADPNGDWMNTGVSYIDAKTFKVPVGMELDARAGLIRWLPDTPPSKRNFDFYKVTFEYKTNEEANPEVENPYKGKSVDEIPDKDFRELIANRLGLLDENQKMK